MASKEPMLRAEAEKVHQVLKEAHPSLGMSIDDAGEHNGVGVWCVAVVPPVFGGNGLTQASLLQLAQRTLGRELPDAAVYIRAIERHSPRSQRNFMEMVQPPSQDDAKRER